MLSRKLFSFKCVFIIATSTILAFTFIKLTLTEKLINDTLQLGGQESGSRDSYLIEIRNELSEQLNKMKMVYGRLSCDHLELRLANGQKVFTDVSKLGGWCKNASSIGSNKHKFDRKMATALSNFLEGKMVASFGEGPGYYKRFIDETRKLEEYAAFDGAPYCEETTNGLVRFLDLTAPQYGMKLYDWVISLEVAEHIPPEYEHVYINNIVRHSAEGIIISWAVPGQTGLSHVNNRPFSYVKQMLFKNGFTHDANSSEYLKSYSTNNWFRNNVNVFRRLATSPPSLTDI